MDLSAGLAVVQQIREAVGDRMEIAIELHAKWNLPSAIRIARALEPSCILWFEDAMTPDPIDDALGGGMNLGWRVFNARAPLNLELGRRWIAAFRALRHLVVGDFYPLLPHTLSESQWLAAQHDRPVLGEGMVVAFRRPYCPMSAVFLHAQGLEPEAAYVVDYGSSGERVE